MSKRLCNLFFLLRKKLKWKGILSTSLHHTSDLRLMRSHVPPFKNTPLTHTWQYCSPSSPAILRT